MLSPVCKAAAVPALSCGSHVPATIKALVRCLGHGRWGQSTSNLPAKLSLTMLVM